ncbi:MAG: 30S ribosomal protein S6 [Dehalococcoidia bacterium]
MNEYEIVIVFNPRLSKSEIDSMFIETKNMILGDEGTLISEMDWGKRKLAYQIGDNLEAFYFIVRANLDPARINDIESKLNINEDILRFLLINEILGELNGPTKLKDTVSKEG